MNAGNQKPRLAVVSPFLDKGYGTERIVIEWIVQLAAEFEIHVYSQEVKDIDFSKIVWHRIPKLPGPHIINFLWWLAANHIWRGWDRRFRGLQHDIVFSPGPNCLDADLISVHIVFAEYLQRVRSELQFARNPVWIWPKLLHRKLYYRLAIWLESVAYKNPETVLILIAQKTAAQLERFYGRRDQFPVVYLGLDFETFNPVRRAALRRGAKEKLGLQDDAFALLLIGNDWRNKGLPVLLEALALMRDLPIQLLVVGKDDPARFRPAVLEKGLDGRISFLPPRSDVEFYYAAADAYAGPSLEDTFALPPAEAMASGLPVIVSIENGTCEIITDGVDGLILRDPNDASTLASMIRRLYEDKELCSGMGKKAAETAAQYTWERNGRELSAILQEILQRKARPQPQSVTQES